MHKLKPTIAEIKCSGNEPDYTDVVVTEQSYQGILGRGLNWYNYLCDATDDRAFLEDWIKTYKTTEDLKFLTGISDKFLPSSYAHCARMQLRGFPLEEDSQGRIWMRVIESYEKSQKYKQEESNLKAAPAPEPVDHSGNVIDYIEDAVSAAFENKKMPSELRSIVSNYKLKDKQFQYVTNFVTKILTEYQELEEARASKNPTDDQEQLIEGYERLSVKNNRMIIASLTAYIQELEGMSVIKKITRTRKVKPLDKNKIVRKIRFLPADAELGIASEKLIGLIGASELWVYDTKTRKLGVLNCQVDGSISAKGINLIGINEERSTCRVLRKPKEQLKEFMSLKKNQYWKWYNSLTTKPQSQKPRTTATTVFLRIT
jgi:hypothetical protein